MEDAVHGHSRLVRFCRPLMPLRKLGPSIPPTQRYGAAVIRQQGGIPFSPCECPVRMPSIPAAGEQHGRFLARGRGRQVWVAR